MSRVDFAWALIVIMVVAVTAVVVLTARYNNYKRRYVRGSRHAKPAWKPFWIK